MKLLRDFFLRAAGRATASGRVSSRAFNVTVPAPLSESESAGMLLPDEPRVSGHSLGTPRREPASFLKAPRHRRSGGAR